MNWQDIKISEDNTHFIFESNPVFDRYFSEVLKFHYPGIAPVKDETGAYHIDCLGNDLYPERYLQAFGYYCNRAAVVKEDSWFHITHDARRAYPHSFSWTGNYQENLCTVRDSENNYFHIDLDGNRIYPDSYVYCGDFKDGYASVKSKNGFYRHINQNGAFLGEKEFLDLGVFHKKFATARDEDGWFHIDKTGHGLYLDRFLSVEPFYNGFALVETFACEKHIIDETGKLILKC